MMNTSLHGNEKARDTRDSRAIIAMATTFSKQDSPDAVMFSTNGRFTAPESVVIAEDSCMPNPEATDPVLVNDTREPAVMEEAAVNGIAKFYTRVEIFAMFMFT